MKFEFVGLETLQINVGNRCNLRCRHCHVNASPEGSKVMGRNVIDKILAFLSDLPDVAADVTGGAPEMNPDFKYFMEGLCENGRRVMVRTNLTVFFEDGLDWIPRWYHDNNVVVIASLPCYTHDNVDAQRGDGVFDKSIKALEMLNELGYGCKGGGELDLVYNPKGPLLPGGQDELEKDYKKHLLEEYGIRFNNLFVMTNSPIGRFRKQLKTEGKLDEYMTLLKDNYNEAAAENVMCRRLLSVDYEGKVYNCDFNQAVSLPIIHKQWKPLEVDQIDEAIADGINVITGDHCYACSAGAGSSCTGSVV